MPFSSSAFAQLLTVVRLTPGCPPISARLSCLRRNIFTAVSQRSSIGSRVKRFSVHAILFRHLFICRSIGARFGKLAHYCDPR